MLTREQILEIDMYCAEHKVTQESRLDELNIPRHQFYRWKKRYRESDEAGQTPEGGSFLQLTPGGSFVSPMMPPSRTSGKTKGGPGTAVAESFLTRKLTLAHPFDANRKHNLSITLPDFTSYTYTMEVIDNPVDFDYAAGISSTRKIKSFKSNGDPVAWHVQGFYNSSSDAETKSGAISTPSWIDAYSATIMSGGLNAGGNSVELSIKHGAVTPSVSVISSDIASTINSIIAGRTPVGTSGEPINLANPNNAGTYPSTYIAESANCYVVNRAGWYKIPLVMGNGVNTANSEFVNYKGAAVSYSSNVAYLSSQGGTPTTAKIIWEDVEGLITGADSSNGWVIPDAISGNWLRFYIDKEHIKQGNAIIAVYDNASTPLVMWSYHIWVTDYVPVNYASPLGKTSGNISLTNTNSPAKTYSASPYNLGWVVAGSVSNYYLPLTTYVRLQQGTPANEEGQHCVMSLIRPSHGSPSQADLNAGHGVYYQFGRKDPLQGDYTTYGVFSGLNQSSSSGVDISSSLTSFTTTGQVVGGIRNPGKTVGSFLGSGSGSAYPGNSANYVHRLWDAAHTNSNSLPVDEEVTKTMYDPCPFGYHVPSYDFFKGVSLETFPSCGYRNGGTMDNTPYYWYATTSTGVYSVAFRLNSTPYTYAARGAAVSIRPVHE